MSSNQKTILSFLKKPVNSVNSSNTTNLNTNDAPSKNVNSASSSLSENDISLPLIEPYYPPKTFIFPKTKFGSRKSFLSAPGLPHINGFIMT